MQLPAGVVGGGWWVLGRETKETGGREGHVRRASAGPEAEYRNAKLRAPCAAWSAPWDAGVPHNPEVLPSR